MLAMEVHGMEGAYTFAPEATPAADDVRYVRDRLAAYHRQPVGDDHHQRLAIFVRDRSQAIVAGLVGDTYCGRHSHAARLAVMPAAIRCDHPSPLGPDRSLLTRQNELHLALG